MLKDQYSLGCINEVEALLQHEIVELIPRILLAVLLALQKKTGLERDARVVSLCLLDRVNLFVLLCMFWGQLG